MSISKSKSKSKSKQPTEQKQEHEQQHHEQQHEQQKEQEQQAKGTVPPGRVKAAKGKQNNKQQQKPEQPTNVRTRIQQVKKVARNMGFLPAILTKKQLTQDPLKLLLDVPVGNHDDYSKTFLALPTEVLENTRKSNSCLR